MRIARGTTLIEFLAAFAVITTGLMAVMGLALSNRTLSQGNVDQMIATNLAREGIELIMQMRDSNWLAGAPFDGGSLTNGTGDGTGTFVWSGDPAQASPAFDFTATTFADDATNIVLIGANPAFMANKNAAAGITGAATPYRRLITLTALCDDNSGSYLEAANQACPPAQTRVGIRIKSELRWSRRGSGSGVVMYNDLYDWR